MNKLYTLLLAMVCLFGSGRVMALAGGNSFAFSTIPGIESILPEDSWKGVPFVLPAEAVVPMPFRQKENASSTRLPDVSALSTGAFLAQLDCVDGDCPDPLVAFNSATPGTAYPSPIGSAEQGPLGLGNPASRGLDASYMVVLGEDLNIPAPGGAEIEGRVALLGDIDMDRVFSYGIGESGGGTFVTSAGGEYALVVGGNVDIVNNNAGGTGRIGVGFNNNTSETARIGGSVTMGNLDAAVVEQNVGLANLMLDVSGILAEMTTVSNNAAAATATGSFSGSTVTGTGAALEVINVASTSLPTGQVTFSNIAPGATVVINVSGTNPVINFSPLAGRVNDPGFGTSDPDMLVYNLIWNFNDATSITINNSQGYFNGSIMSPSGSVTLNTNLNGRLYTGGSLTHAGGGTEVHNYPFTGDLTSFCGNAVCAITNVAAFPGTCDPATNTYEATVTVTFENDLGGILRVSIDGQDAAINDPISPQQFTVSGLTADGMMKNVTATFDDDPSCTATVAGAFTAPTGCAPTGCTTGLGGNVFIDGNNDGADAGAGEVGQAGVTVEVYECDGTTPVATVMTDATGNWNTNAALTYPVRVEFSTPGLAGLQPGVQGTGSGTNVQFIDAATCTVNYGLLDEAAACAIFEENFAIGSTSPVTGNLLTGGIAFISCGAIDDDQIPESEQYTIGLIDVRSVPIADDRPEVTTVLDWHHPDWTVTQIGNVYGTAVDKEGNFYTTASSQYGPSFGFITGGGQTDLYRPSIIRYGEIGGAATGGGIDNLAAAGTVYKMDRTTGQPTVFAQLPQQSFSFEHTACESGDPDFARNTGPGLGNMDHDEVHNQFFVSNFEDGKIYRLDDDGNIIDSFDPQTLTGFTVDDGTAGWASDYKPYGLAVSPAGDRLYFGIHPIVQNQMVNGQAISLEDANVYYVALDATGAFSGTEQFVVTTQPDPPGPNLNGDINFFAPDPAWFAVADLHFNPNGDLVIGHRTGCGTTDANFNPIPSFASSYNHGASYFIFDIDNGSLTNIESRYAGDTGTGGFGTGTGNDDVYGGIGIWEKADGSFVYVVSSSDIVEESGPHGLLIFPDDFTQTGNNSNEFILEPAAAIPYISRLSDIDLKGWGGDSEVFNACAPAAIQIGNYAWIDTDMDGVQDACEDPLTGLPVVLYTKADDGTITQVATTTTDATTGEYYFDGVLPDTSYVIAFGSPSASGVISSGNLDYTVTALDSGEGSSADLNDSDASFTTIDNQMLIAICYNTADTTTHDLDVGFQPAQPCSITAISTSPGTCDPATNTYDATVTVTFENDLGGILRVSIDGQDAAINDPVSPQEFTVSGLTADGMLKTVTATFDDDPDCTLTATDNYMAPANCLADCSISFSNIQSTNCNNDTFTGTFGLDYVGAPTTGTIEYSTNDDGNYISTGVVPTGTATGQAVVIDGLDCNTRSIQLRFSDDTDCAIYIAYSFGPIDPAGYIYCVEDGTIVEGGTVTVGLPPGGNFQFLNAANGDPLDGRNGRYAFVAVGTGGNPPVAGEYTITYTPPNGEPLVANSTPFGNGDDILDPTQTVDGGTGDNDQTDVNMNLLVGSNVNAAGTMLQDFSLTENPYFTRFDLTPGDPFIDLNNLPLQCLPDCDRMEILEEGVSCTDNGDGTYDFEVSFQVFWNYDNATNETISIMIDGAEVEVFTPPVNAGSSNFGPYTLTVPDFNVPISAAFSEKTSCQDTRFVDLIACTPACDNNPNEVGGNVFVDSNNDGADAGAGEVGQANVLVRVYDCNEMLLCEVYTNADGNWSCDAANAGDSVRVEYTTPLTPWLTESFAGVDNGTSTQFVVGGNCTANYGLFEASRFCDEQPDLALSCFVGGTFDGAASDFATLLRVPYTAEGVPGDAGYLAPEQLATHLETGTVWGSANNPGSTKIYYSALLRRHTGFGPMGPGGIYELDKETGAVNQWLDLATLGVDVGTDPRDPNSGADSIPTVPFLTRTRDSTAFFRTARMSFGDMDMAEDNRSLWITNLKTKEIIQIDLATKVILRRIAITGSLIGRPSASQEDIIPWGLKPHQGRLYIGVTHTAQTTQDLTELDGYVLSVDANDPADVPVEALRIDFDYDRPVQLFGGDTDWRAWNELATSVRDDGRMPLNPQPLISNIEFDAEGNMIVGVMDVFGYKVMAGNHSPYDTDDGTDWTTAGDILRACRSSSGFELEGSAGCPVVGDEFFNDNSYRSPPRLLEIFNGSMAYAPVGNKIVGTATNPTQTWENGLTWLDAGSGGRERPYRIYRSADNGFENAFVTSGKSSGLGDIEFLCGTPPLQIGNYAWIDTDGDGLQDPCEPPLEGLMVKLYRKNSDDPAAPILIATDVTDATGNYYFSSASAADGDAMQQWIGTDADTSIVRDSAYFIAFCGDGAFNTTENSLNVNGMRLCPSPANVGQAAASNPTDGSDDQNDSDIIVQTVGADMVPAYCTTAGELAGGTNHTFDAGFKPLECNVEISDLEIICNNGDDFVFSFDLDYMNTIPSNTLIEVLLDGAPITGSPFTTTGTAGSIDVESIMVADPNFSVPLVARFVGSAVNCEDSQLLDFIACTPTCDDRVGNANIVGGNAFLDQNNDGMNDGETGQPNVLVRVYDCAEMLVCEVYTDANGDWSCDNAMAGDTFRVEYTTPLSPGLTESFVGPDNGTSTQFVLGGTCAADYGLVDATQQCIDQVVLLSVPCYEGGDYTGSNANNTSVVSFGADASGSATPPMTDATLSQLGATWGGAYNQRTNQLYLGTVLKRHSDFADGPGYVYQIDYSSETMGTFVSGYDLQGVVPVNRPGQALDFGSVCRDASCATAAGNTGIASDYVIPSDPTAPSVDLDAFAKVGTVGYGDLEYDYGTDLIWTVNLNERSLLSFDVTSGGAPTDVNAYSITGLPGVPACSGGELRPWGLNFTGGVGYLGIVCDASATGSMSNLKGYVLSFDPTNPSAGFAQVLEVPLQEESRGDFDDGPFTGNGIPTLVVEGDMIAWVNDPDDFPQLWVDAIANQPDNQAVTLRAGQPIISDIAVTPAGDVIVGILDRTSFQLGDDNYTPVSGSMQQASVFNYGDIIYFCADATGGYTKEGSGSGCVPPNLPPNGQDDVQFGAYNFGNDYFNLNGGDNSRDYAQGSLVLLPESGELAYTVTDPFPPNLTIPLSQAEQQPFLQSQGVHWNSLSTGDRVDWFQIVSGGNGNVQYYGKGVGLGDLVSICGDPPVQIGNYAWLDTDADGLQDPCEPPLAGLAVKLYRKNSDDPDAPILIATDTTDATGNYYFSSASAADGDAMQNWLGTDADTTVNRDSLYFIAFCGQSGFDTGTNSLIVDGVSLCPSPANMGQQAASDATDGSADQNDSDITVQDVAGVMIPAYCTTAGELADGTNHTFDAGFKPLEFDLALTKKISTLETDNSFRPGDQVIFDIAVINQGDVTAFDIVVGDSIPTGLTYDATGTTATGTSTLTSVGGVTIDFVNDYMLANDGSFTVDSLPAKDTVVFQVAVTIDAIGTSQAARPLINYAEIQAADNDEDPTNTPPDDVDSTPNDNFSDDPGGVPGGETDDQDDGDGTGTPGNDGPGDEDDADPALVPIYDIALTKIIDPASIDPNANYSPGDLIVFNLNVANQANDTIGGFTVTDYLPCGYTFNSAATSNGADNTGWSLSGMQLTFTTTDDLLPNGGSQVQLVLTYQDDLCGGTSTVDTAFINRAEISEFTNTAGDPVDDFDSVPDDNPGNDPGGMVDSPSDNEVGGNGTGTPGDDVDTTDEDDSDPASLSVFDLAIFKVVDSTDMANVGPYVFGDVVKYQIGVVEQGNLPATDVTVKDITPPGLRFDPSLGMNATPQGGGTWADNGDGTVSLDISDFSTLNTAGTADLGGGDTALVCIWLEVVVPGGAIDDNSFVNYAGIEEATFDDPQLGTPVTVTGDGDSDYDLPVGGDTGGGVGTPDDNETTDNTPGDDIDSQDPASIEVLLGVAVGDTTFIDVNMDGLQDAGDQALPGVTVTVYDATTMMPVTTDVFGQPYSNTRQTDALGAYLFDSLPSGNYYVEFDISTAPNGDLYDYTTPNVGGNAGASDSLDSDVTPAAPTDDVANSDETGLIPPGDTVLTLDAGVVCAIMVTVADPSTICRTQDVDLTQGASIVPDRLGGFWTTTGTGTFFDPGGTALTANPITGGYAFGTAVRYEPSAADGRAGEVTFTLTTNDPANLAPASVCTPQSASVTITILNVDCGSFFWDGGE